jgi:DNA-binding winged helix-turn-helix (wHTH) protein/tetratricopeptide (TPR) repeat protein
LGFLKRSGMHSPVYRFAHFELDPSAYSLRRGGVTLNIERIPLDLLFLLVERRGDLITRSDILDRVWGKGVFVDAENAVNTAVRKLRRALSDDPSKPQFIATVPTKGYRFIGVVDVADRGLFEIVKSTAASDGPIAGADRLIVGRENDLDQLRTHLQRASRGTRQIVFVTGEPGIGKTTVIDSFSSFLARGHEARIGRGQCIEQYGAGEPYMPVLEALTRLCKEAGGDHVVEVLNRVAPSWLAQMPALLSQPEREHLERITQGVTQPRMLREMAEGLEVIAAQIPLVLLIEDLHWSDPSTLDLIGTVARRREPARLMIVGTYRPVEMLAGEHPLRAMKEELELHQQAVELRLPLLSKADVAGYLAQRFSDGTEKIASAVYARSEGNPLFMVNVIDYLVEQGSFADADKIEAPRNIRQMIERNLQRLLPDEQRILEAASVAGAVFSAASIAAVLERPLAEIDTCCTQLAKREQFVARLGPSTWPDGTSSTGFRFRHALYSNVLYDAIPDSHRLEFHRRIADRLEAAYDGRVSEIAAVLANHYRRANEMDKAARYFQRAGEGAVARHAYREAERHYRDALALLLTLPESPERDARELTLQVALGPVLGVTTGFAARDTNALYARARSLSARNVTEESLGAIWGLWLVATSRGEVREALVLAEQMREIASALGSSRGLVEALYARGVTSHWFGDLIESNRCLQYVCEHYRESESGNAPHDFAAYARAFRGINDWLLGYPDQARRLTEEARALALRRNIPFSVVMVGAVTAQHDGLRGDFASAQASAEAAEQLSAELGFDQLHAGAGVIACWAKARLKAAPVAVELIRTRLAEAEALGFLALRPYFLCCLAETQALAGGLGDALATVNQALKIDTDNRWYRPLAFTLRGDLLLKDDPADSSQRELAERDFRDAIGLSRTMSAKSPELHATTSLARLLRDTGRRDAARTMLADIYGWFTEAFDTADLREAKALLDELD